MGTISDKLTYLNTTKSQLKDMINNGLDDNNKITSSTTFRNYVTSIFNAFLEALRTPDTLFTNLPKKSGTGANITLNDTANAPMRITLGSRALEQKTNLFKGGIEQGSLVNGEPSTGSNRVRTIDYISVVPNTTIPISFTGLNQYVAVNYNSSKSYVSQINWANSGTDYTIPNNTYYIKLIFKNTTGTDITPSSLTSLQVGNPPNPSYPQDIHTISGSNTIKVEGKNLFDNTITPVFEGGSTSNTINTGYRLVSTVNGTSDSNNACRYVVHDITPFIGQKITLSAHAKSSSTNKGFMYLRLCKQNGDVTNDYGTQGTSVTLDGDLSVSYTIPSGIGEYHYLMVALYSTRNSAVSIGDYIDYTNLQVEVSASKTSYTPYTLETKDIDLKSKNLFNESNSQIGKAWNNSSNTARAIILTKVQPSTQYTISFNSLSGVDSIWYFTRENENDSTSVSGNNQITQTTTITTASNVNWLGIQVNKTNVSQIDINNIKIQIVEGSNKLSYREYYDYGECGSIGNYENIPIRTFGKQLFDISTITQGKYIDGIGGLIDTANSNTSDWIEVKANQSYTLTWNYTEPLNSQAQREIVLYNYNKQFVTTITLVPQNLKIKTFTPSQSGYIRFDYDKKCYDIMLNEGETALPYEPYGNGTWYLKQEIGKVVLDGTETLNKNSGDNTNYLYVITDKCMPACYTKNGEYH